MISLSLALAAKAHPMIDFDLTVLLQLGVFAILFFLGNQWLFQPYLKLRAAREAGIEGARDEATRMSAEAGAKDADYQRALTEARAKASAESRAIRDQASAHEREVTAKAAAEAAAALRAAESTVRAQTDAARTALAAEAGAISAQVVRRMLGREVA